MDPRSVRGDSYHLKLWRPVLAKLSRSLAGGSGALWITNRNKLYYLSKTLLPQHPPTGFGFLICLFCSHFFFFTCVPESRLAVIGLSRNSRVWHHWPCLGPHLLDEGQCTAHAVLTCGPSRLCRALLRSVIQGIDMKEVAPWSPLLSALSHSCGSVSMVLVVGHIENGQQYYNFMVEWTGCSRAIDILSCLRKVPCLQSRKRWTRRWTSSHSWQSRHEIIGLVIS